MQINSLASRLCERTICRRTISLQQQHAICHRSRSTIAKASDAAATATNSSVIVSRHGDISWASCTSKKTTVASAVKDAVDSIMQQQQADFAPDLALVFASCNYGSQLQDVVKAIRREVPSVRVVFGCSAYGVLGSSPDGAVEVEGVPGISLSLAALPGVELSVMHTLRSTIPTEDASPEAWWDLVGMNPVEQLQQSPAPSSTASADEGDTQEDSSSSSSNGDDGNDIQANSSSDKDASSSSRTSSSMQQPDLDEAVSFLILCDPRFQQSKELLAGLDFAFPNSTKVGAVLSQGQQNKRRLMFVWAADSSVQPGTAAWARQQQQRNLCRGSSPTQAPKHSTTSRQTQQQQQQLEAVMEPLPVQQQQLQSDPGKNRKQKGLFGSLFDALLSGVSDEQQQQQQQQQQQEPAGSSNEPAATAAATDQSSTVGADASDEDEAPSSGDSGVFMYGAAVLSMKGPFTLEPITCQGYRTVSDKVWTIGQTSRDGDLIGTLIDPDEAEDEDEGEAGEVVPLLAIYELLMSAGFNPELPAQDFIEELSSKLAVAIAPDSWRPASQLQTDDFQVAAISEVWQKTGYIRVDSQARPGYRLRLVLRDERGMREDLTTKLLGIKRTELAGVLTGKKRAAPLATLMFSDIGRGSMLYDTPNYESGMVSSYLPAPLAGMFGSAQFSTVNSKAALFELTSALAVLRPLEGKRKQTEQHSSEQ